MTDNRSRASTAQKILKIYSGSLVLGTVSSALQYISYKDFLSTLDINDFTDANMPFKSLEGIGELLQYQNIIVLLNIALFGLFIANSITFIQWLRRSYYNLHEIADFKPSYSIGMAAGAWWIPIGNLFVPATILKDIWKGFCTYLGQDPKKDSGISTAWSMWVASWILAIVGGFYIMSSTMGLMMAQASQVELNNGSAASLFLLLEAMTEMNYYMIFLSAVVTLVMTISGFLMSSVIGKISDLEEQVLEKHSLQG